MPSWRTHRRMGRSFGFDEKLMSEVDRMLDFPRLHGCRLPHKVLYSTTGVIEVWRKLGDEAASYALLHVILDKSRLGKLIEGLEALGARIESLESALLRPTNPLLSLSGPLPCLNRSHPKPCEVCPYCGVHVYAGGVNTRV